MATKRTTVSAPVVIDPLDSPVDVTLNGNTYKLSFSFESLATAEAHFLAQGIAINILSALPQLNLTSVRTIFPCALHKYHSEISFKDAQSMINISNVFDVALSIRNAWLQSLPEADTDPQLAAPVEE